MHKKLLLLAAASCCLWLSPTDALSAPFCVESQGVPAECWFYDIRSCRQEAEKRGGICSVNMEEIELTDQGAPFCIMDSSMIPVCAYQGGETCHEEAGKRDAVCFQNTGGEVNNDPYRYDRPEFRYQ
jgi:hypothetical protein